MKSQEAIRLEFSDAFDQGVIARLKGSKKYQNPYFYLGAQRNGWSAGWAAQDEILKARETAQRRVACAATT